MAFRYEQCFLEYTVTCSDLSLSLYLEPVHPVRSDEITDQIRLHIHMYAELFVCLDGTVYIRTERELLSVPGGTVCIIPAGTEHYFETSEKGSQWCAFGITCKSVKRKRQDIYPVFRSCFLEGKPHMISGTAEQCRTLYLSCKAEDRKEQRYLPYHMLHALLVIAEQFEKNGRTNTASSAGCTGDFNRLTTLEQIITSEFSLHATARDIAERLFMSERQLDRVSKKQYGMSVHQVIMKTRVEAAQQLLLGTDMPAEKIGSQVGFQSKSCFYREFRDRTGKTPLEYRAEHKKA